MAALQFENIADDLNMTLSDLGPYKWTDIVSAIQDHVFADAILDAKKVGFKSGKALDFNIQVNPSNSAKMTGLYAQDNVNRVDTMTKGSTPWKHLTSFYTIDEREVSMNREPARIVELLKELRSGAMTSLAELIETIGWSQPTNSSDTDNIFGVPYWIVPNTTDGFNGGNPFGFTAGCAGVSSTAYPNWANYTNGYATVTKQDLIRKMRKAAMFCNFKSAKMANIPDYKSSDRKGYYTDYTVYGAFAESLEKQNDNLGNDIASKDGEAVFRRNPIVWVPKFEVPGFMGTVAFSNTTYASSGMMPFHPVYGIHWGHLRPVFLEGEYMKETGLKPAPDSHRVLRNFCDTTMNVECRNRREQFVLTM